MFAVKRVVLICVAMMTDLVGVKEGVVKPVPVKKAFIYNQ